MRRHGWLLGLALLGSAPAMAMCPPSGYDKAGLQALKSAGFAVADPAGKQALAMGLVDCLGDPDPLLRDGIAYEALQHWMRAGDFDAAFLRRLRDALYAGLDADDASADQVGELVGDAQVAGPDAGHQAEFGVVRLARDGGEVGLQMRCAQCVDHHLHAGIAEGDVEQAPAEIVRPADLLAADAVGGAGIGLYLVHQPDRKSVV